MKVEQQHIDQIRQDFLAIASKEDLVLLLTKAKRLFYDKEEISPVRLRSLNYYANPKFTKKRYKTFRVKKKSGGERIINAPVKGLKGILRPLNFVLQCVAEPHQAATGFVMGKSIVDNARAHVNQHYVFNTDLKDFFHSFDRNRVKMGLWYHYFKMDKAKEPIAFLIAALVTHPFEIDGETRVALPQGSPCSPTLTNILCKQLDRRLAGLAKRFGAVYTRYADDITFSCSRNIFNQKEFQDELKRIIEEDQQLEINEKKTRLQKNGYRKEVTGLVVNDKVNVRRRYIKDLRKWLYLWGRYGYKKAEEKFLSDYMGGKGHVKKDTPNMVFVLDGKLEYLKMVKGVNNRTYFKLKNRFEKLITKEDTLSEVLDIWESEGIEKAMGFFYKKDIKNSDTNPYSFTLEELGLKDILD